MSYYWYKIAEEKITEAAQKGELDNLPGQGKPLELENDSNLDEEVRLTYKVLKNAGYTPPELDVKKEINQIEDFLAGSPDEKSRYKALKRLNYLTMKMGSLRPQTTSLANSQYAARLVNRMIKKPEKKEGSK
ncbi:DnaJ family domain-containing protein [Dethiosulfatarculus sandiegensis]|uniref:Molecular chaperone DnaJ n=1 Tax=Dethiosulfatarculus sandiegensis TaxID=1429043 RepID=A0A0D2J6L3_9BACT|nr:DnaJ family domain-containing protein [Dethiosulfatarculus sandiegensis]KIX11326.1 molecular chaperone DnaJ [Dethiosulfatarculus sandiegensis]